MRRFIAVCTLAAGTFASSLSLAAPLKCPSNDVVAGPAAASDAVLTTDPVQKGHLYVANPGVPAVTSTCAAPKAAPAVVDATMDFHYKAHTFKNRSTSAACIDVRFVFAGGAQGIGFHETTAYLGSFDPNDVTKNYLGDAGSNDGGNGVNQFSVTVPPMADFVLVASWTGPATPGYEPSYQLNVAGCGQMVITGVTPNAGPSEGGQAVSILGSGFEGIAPATVAVGGPAALVGIVDDGTINVTTAAHAAGVVDVSVTSAGGGSATLVGGYTYGAAATADAGADAGADASTDGGLDGGFDASTHGPTQGGPTQGSSSSGGTTSNDAGTTADGGGGDDDDGDAATTGDGGAKRVSGTKKKTSGGDEELVCACNEVGRGTTPGVGAFLTMALGAIAVLRLRKRR